MDPRLIEETLLSLQLGMLREKEGGNKLLRWPRKEESYLLGEKRVCRIGTNGGDDEDAHVENEMMIDEEQPVLEAQTSKAVEELKSSVQGKGAMQKRVAALRELRRLLSKSEFPPIDVALSAGAIPLLVQCLSFGSPDEQLLEAAWCLTNIAAGKPEETKSLLPALPLLIAHVGEKSSAPVAEQCAWAIGNVAGEGEELRNVLLSQGALPPLARMIFPDKGSTVRTAAWALSNLIKGPESKAAAQLVRVDGIVEAILRHLKKTDEEIATEIATEIAWIVVYLSALSDIATSMLLKGGILQLLVERLATSHSLQLLIPVLQSVGNFVSVDPKAMLTILISGQNTEENVIGVLAKCLRSEHRVLKKEAAWVLSNIAAGSIEHKRMIHSTEAMPLLLRLLSTSPFDIRKEVAYVLGNLSPDIEAARLGLQFIELVLRGMPNGEGPKLVEGEDGIDAMERFQFHENEELRVMANSLVDKYFGEDYGIAE
ncbi:unnamed protein product [Eruca vesicaria subsp. sativa]|uniref:Importin subunit alpha n=1 Tax=Eruca vesicaria subsp. sativa TaxID=29727 RepID=A0ABC8L912_ERUVS|nr:unnamed protein product [Eruca vesicaria subsp. sativa]